MITRRQSLRALVGLALAGKGVPAAFTYTVPKRKKDVLDEINVVMLEYFRENGPVLANNFFARDHAMLARFREHKMLDGGASIQDSFWYGND